MPEINLTFNEQEDLPNFSLQKSDGGDPVKVPMLEVLEASASTEGLTAQREQLQLHVLNKYQIRVPDYVASIMMEKASVLYEDLKKNCESLQPSND